MMTHSSNKSMKASKQNKPYASIVDWLLSTENPCPPEDFDWVKLAVHPCQVSYDDIGLSEYDEDYTNLLNTVQRHTKCNSAYCLRRKTPNKDMTCRFNFPFEKCSQTYIQFEQITSKDETEKYRAKIVTKRNDPRLNSHQRIQLQGWRANCDIQVVIDCTAWLEYLTKYASKPEGRAPTVNNLLNSILSSTDNTSTKLIKKLMIKRLGECDISAQEAMHLLLSLKLYSSTFFVIPVNLDGSRRIKVNYHTTDSQCTEDSR